MLEASQWILDFRFTPQIHLGFWTRV
jgi:hypothetical protein